MRSSGKRWIVWTSCSGGRADEYCMLKHWYSRVMPGERGDGGRRERGVGKGEKQERERGRRERNRVERERGWGRERDRDMLGFQNGKARSKWCGAVWGGSIN